MIQQSHSWSYLEKTPKKIHEGIKFLVWNSSYTSAHLVDDLYPFITFQI